MNLLLMLALFVLTLLILLRIAERGLTLILGLLLSGLVLLVALANLNTPHAPTLAPLALLHRPQGFLTAAGVALGGLILLLGQGEGMSFRRSRQPLRLQRTAKPPTRTKRTRTGKTAHDAQGGAGGTQELQFEKYDVLDRVGVGGMGSVYRARRKADGKTVALKVPQERYLADAKFLKRFYREAELLKRFDHPSVVSVYDYRMQDGEHYIAMEFLDGESLEHLLEERPPTYEQSVQILRALSDALRHIHAQNVVHRDIKPANVMVMRGAFDEHGKLKEGGVKLMDFGIAVGKVLTRLTSTGARVGTPVYMAPEQAKGNRVDNRSDVYSLGLMAYEMISGQVAFKGSYEAVVHQQVFETPKSPKEINMDIPGKLSDLIMAMIAKDPAARLTLDEVIERIDEGVMTEEPFTDPVALAVSLQERRGMLRLLDLTGKLRQSLRDLTSNEQGLPSLPTALTSDAQGHLYLSLSDYRQSSEEGMIRKLDHNGETLLAFGPHGLQEGQLLQPVALAISHEQLYVLDAESLFVNIFTLQGQYLRRFGGRGQGLGKFSKPVHMVASPAGELFVLDTGNQEIQRFTPNGDYLSRYAFRAERDSEKLRPLEGVAVDTHGNVYIVDGLGKKLRRIAADGKPGITFALESLVGEPTDAPWLLQVTDEGQIFAVRKGGQVLRTYSAMGDLLGSQDLYAPVQAIQLLSRSHLKKRR